jgi:hypothetical protein
MTASQWATAIAESIAADRSGINAVELADRVYSAMVDDGYLMGSTAELQATCEAAARKALT